MRAVSQTHAVDTAGHEVSYTRYSVTYRDARGENVIAAEFDEDGRLLVHGRGMLDVGRRERMERLLRFLGAQPVFD
jgi:hypothetical protein